MRVGLLSGGIGIHLELPYGKGRVPIEVPEGSVVLEQASVEPGTVEEALSKGLANPIGAGSIEDFIRDTKRLVIIVNDGTRPTPTATVLKHIHPLFKDHPDLTILMACGTHRPPNEDEKRRILGDLYDELLPKLRWNEAKDGTHLHVGTTSRGTPVAFNPLVMEADGVITIGSTVPHYFAGFGGGRKSFLPGVAAYDTVETNHRHALEEGSETLAIEGNPVAEDMEEAVRLLGDKRIFTIQLVTTADHRLYSVSTGDLFQAHAHAMNKARELYCSPLEGKGNIVVAVKVYPGDINLYQSQKALEHGRLALEKGGVIILVSQCWDGLGDEVFIETLESLDSWEDAERVLGGDFKLGYQKAARIMSLWRDATIYAVTDVPGEQVQRAKMVPFPSAQEALDSAIEKVASGGKEPRVIIMPNAGETVPDTSGRPGCQAG